MAIDAEALQALKAKVWCDVLLPGEAGFAQAAATAGIPADGRIPAVIVRVRSTMDVQEAVRFATEQKLEISVKGGGHSAANWGIVNGGLCIDLSLMRSVYVDPAKKIAIVAGGSLLGDIDRETAVHNMMVPLGHAPVTGLGLALGGGLGVASRIFGLTGDHIIGATIVKADGSVVVVDESSDPDLLWAVRGAGAAMGVVTSLTFKLNQLDDNCYTGVMVWPDDEKHNNWKSIASWMATVAYHEPGLSLNLMRAYMPDGNPILMSMIVFVGDKSRAEKEAVVQPLRDLGPMCDNLGKVRYVDTQFALRDPLAAMPPHFQYWTSGQTTTKQITSDFLDEFVNCAINPFTPDKFPTSIVLFDLWGGAHIRKSEGLTSLTRGDAEMGWMQLVGYLDPGLHEEARKISKHTKAVLSSHGDTGGYLNFNTANPGSEEAQLALRVGGPENLKRLRAVKARMDPNNVFKSNPLHGLGVAQ